jgi:uridine kinase
MSYPNIRISTEKTEITVTLPNQLILSGKIGTRLKDFFDYAINNRHLNLNVPLIAAICNNKLRELGYELTQDAILEPITLASSDGGRIYRRSLVLLLVTALKELFGNVKADVGYAVPDGGYFCEMLNRSQLTSAEVEQLEARMQQLVKEDHPITKTTIPLKEALALFEQRNDMDKVRLLQSRTRDELVMYHLCNHSDYYFGYMVPSTAYLATFKLIHVENGFILQYPRQENPTQLGKLDAYGKLSKVFQQSNDWLEKLAVEDVGSLNQLVRNNHVQEMILVNEALHEQQISDIAQDIIQEFEKGVRIVAIAGPSSSGKTTFSKRLAIQLLAQGMQPFTVEMDNFFVNRELTPRDEKGEYDFESLHAINLELFNDILNRLTKNERVQLPKFNFYTGKSENGVWAQLKPQQIIILEGIHGLNPDLFTLIPSSQIYRVYTSSLTQLNLDHQNRVATTDVRLLRRIIRDARTRGYSATDTLKRWSSVRRGEKKNIFPHQENANAMFNSALVYELAALRPLVEPLLLQVDVNHPIYIEAYRLLSFIRWVEPMTEQQRNLIPDTSLVREFIGGSILDAYHPGASHS